jgi:hypothetical protein
MPLGLHRTKWTCRATYTRGGGLRFDTLRTGQTETGIAMQCKYDHSL